METPLRGPGLEESDELQWISNGISRDASQLSTKIRDLIEQQDKSDEVHFWEAKVEDEYSVLCLRIRGRQFCKVLQRTQ